MKYICLIHGNMNITICRLPSNMLILLLSGRDLLRDLFLPTASLEAADHAEAKKECDPFIIIVNH